MDKPDDRLQYADCAYVEAQLRARESGDVCREPLPASFGADAPCPLCKRASNGAEGAARTLPSTADVDALYLRFQSNDDTPFDHVGFAHAVIASCSR